MSNNSTDDLRKVGTISAGVVLLMFISSSPFTTGVLYCTVVECTEETRSQNTEKLSVDQAATVLLNFLQQTREGADENPNDVYFQELPVWKREYF